jgi:hypothetical protein
MDFEMDEDNAPQAPKKRPDEPHESGANGCDGGLSDAFSANRKGNRSEPLQGRAHEPHETVVRENGGTSPNGDETAVPSNAFVKRALTFQGWLGTKAPMEPSLFWSHRTDGERFEKIIRQGFIEPFWCDKLEMTVSYYFYGRPAYVERLDDSMGNTARAPVILLFEPALEELLTTLYPFDTGAFKTDRYKRWLPNHADLSDYSLGSQSDRARRFVSAFYRNNEAYWDMKATPPQGNFALLGLVKVLEHMLTDRANVPADDRRFVVEMAVGEPVPFHRKYIKAVIVPMDMASEYINMGFEQHYGIDMIAYPFSPGRLPIVYQVRLEDLARDANQRAKRFSNESI